MSKIIRFRLHGHSRVPGALLASNPGALSQATCSASFQGMQRACFSCHAACVATLNWVPRQTGCRPESSWTVLTTKNNPAFTSIVAVRPAVTRGKNLGIDRPEEQLPDPSVRQDHLLLARRRAVARFKPMQNRLRGNDDIHILLLQVQSAKQPGSGARPHRTWDCPGWREYTCQSRSTIVAMALIACVANPPARQAAPATWERRREQVKTGCPLET